MCTFARNVKRVLTSDTCLQSNYVLETDDQLAAEKEEYDLILALSLTKWVHFNWGDAGLKRFFRRIFRQLRPGGRLVLEPQAWASYKRKKNLTVSVRILKGLNLCCVLMD